MKRKYKSMIALAVALVMLFSGVPIQAQASESEINSPQAEAVTLSIDNGTYYISNVKFDKLVQIDDNASSTEDGAILELWGRDGASDQKWKLESLSNGYYKILSSASNKAITCPTDTNDALTQKTYTGANTQQWKITDAGNGMFKLSPKSNPSYYMSAGSGIFTSNGRNVEMRTAQSDNKDEWYFLKTTTKYSQVSLDYSSSSSFNENIKKYYEGNAHAYGTTYTSIAESTFVDELTSAKYFGAMLHGGEYEDKLKISSSEVLYLSEIENLPNSDFSSVKIVVLTSCYSGRSGGFVDTLLDKGVDVVIGFNGSIEQKTSAYWTDRFIYALSLGNTVEFSIDYADTELYEEYENTIYSDQLPLITWGRYTGTSDLSLSPCS